MRTVRGQLVEAIAPLCELADFRVDCTQPRTTEENP